MSDDYTPRGGRNSGTHSSWGQGTRSSYSGLGSSQFGQPYKGITPAGVGSGSRQRQEAGQKFKSRFASGTDFDYGGLDRRSAARAAVVAARAFETGSGSAKTQAAKARFERSKKAAAMGRSIQRRVPAGRPTGGQFAPKG